MDPIDPKRVRELLVAARELDSKWKDPVFDWGGEDTLALEHLVHEVAHGQSLKLGPFTSGTPFAVSCSLAACLDKGVREEARVWAIEWTLWPRLGLPWEWDELCSAAEQQYVKEGDITKFLRGRERRRTLELAEQTATEIFRLCSR